MSTQDIRKLSSVVRSIEIIEEKTNLLHSQYSTASNENPSEQPAPIDDSSLDLQLFFQHLEQLLQTDLKNRLFLLNNNNNKRNYWNFFSLALKESKGLYDTVLYVLNSQDAKTSTGRGRLFLRFCLQHHRLGDVIQQSFMMAKTVNQFYVDDCLWMTPTYMNRVIQALYQLNDLQFDLLSKPQYQLDICWPTIEAPELRSKTLVDDAARMRNESASSFISMSSVDSQSIVSVVPETSDSIQIAPTLFANFESSMNGDSSAQSLSSVDEDPENTVDFWKQKCLELEMQLQDMQSADLILPTNDAEIQCSLDEDEKSKAQEIAMEKDVLTHENEQLKTEINSLNEKSEQLQNETDLLTEKNEQLNTEVTVLKEETNNLNFQLSSIAMQRSTASDRIKDYELEISQYQVLIENKDALFNQFQEQYNQQVSQVQSIEEKHLAHLKEQSKRIELLESEMEKVKKLREDERRSMDNERKELNKAQEQLEATLQEKTLDFEEMKRRLLRAVREKAELFSTIHTYEMKLEEQKSRKWMLDEDVSNCTKCGVPFSWTVRRHHCRQCQNIFCNSCSNNRMQSQKTNTPPCRVCDYCNEKSLKNPTTSNDVVRTVLFDNTGTGDDGDLRFEVRPERLSQTIETQSTT